MSIDYDTLYYLYEKDGFYSYLKEYNFTYKQRDAIDSWCFHCYGENGPYFLSLFARQEYSPELIREIGEYINNYHEKFYILRDGHFVYDDSKFNKKDLEKEISLIVLKY